MEKLNKKLYTIGATSVEGRNGSVSSESGRLFFDLIKPESMGGEGGDKTNPEELFACGYAACFGGAMEYVGKQRDLDIKSPEVKVTVHFGTTDSGVGLAADIRARIEGEDDETVRSIMQEAHEKVCPYSKATRDNIEVTIDVLT